MGLKHVSGFLVQNSHIQTWLRLFLRLFVLYLQNTHPFNARLNLNQLGIQIWWWRMDGTSYIAQGTIPKGTIWKLIMEENLIIAVCAQLC